MQSKRTHWIDIARGIGIIFVIYSHVFYVLGNYGYSYLFFAFHMPLFFFLSGVVFNQREELTMFLKKSVKRLLVPYFIFAFLMFGLWAFHVEVHHVFSNSLEVVRQFLSIFYGNSNNGLVFNDVLWFLPTLFVTRILFACITMIFKKTNLLLLLLLFFSLFGYFFSIFAPTVKLPFGLETAFTAIVFYGIGFLWNRSENAKMLIFKYKPILFPTFLLLGSILATFDFINYGHPVDMRLNHLNNYFFFYTDAFLGIFTWIACSMLLNKNYILEKIGKNSLILFAWHPIVFTYVTLTLNSLTSFEIVRDMRILIPSIYTMTSLLIIFSVNSFVKKMNTLLKAGKRALQFTQHVRISIRNISS